MGLNFTVEYQKGKLNEAPNALSQAPLPVAESAIMLVQTCSQKRSESYHPIGFSVENKTSTGLP